MGRDLRERLRRVQANQVHTVSRGEAGEAETLNGALPQGLMRYGWKPCGYQTLKRVITKNAPPDLPDFAPPALAVLAPDIHFITIERGESPQIADFLFFDLETTGLSGGAGTAAFLAAFGRFVKEGQTWEMRVTQYLLLDYPGEYDFIAAVLSEFENDRQIIVTYNGKNFDSQILKTRCILNRVEPPKYSHADLLYPARRLWKGVTSNCSQGTIETEILGIDRSGDTPGFMAPQIWFDFLNNGNEGALSGICDHNARDISGLAEIFAAMINISQAVSAGEGRAAFKKYRFNIEKAALRWRDFTRRLQNDPFYENQMPHLKKAARDLLRLGAEENFPQAAFFYALDQMRSGDYEGGKKRMFQAAAFQNPMQAAALRALAIDCERRLGDIGGAIEFAKKGLALDSCENSQEDFKRRLGRLEKKLAAELF